MRQTFARVPATIAIVVGLALVPTPAVAHVVSYGVVGLGVPGEAYAVNNHGSVVGAGQLAGAVTTHPFQWYRGRLTDLGVLEPGPLEYGRATDVDNAGRVAGFSVVAADPEQSGVHAFRWSSGTLVDLGTLGTDSMAFAVNDRGATVGVSYAVGGTPHAVLWRDGVLADLGPGRAMDVNDHGVIVGMRRDADGADYPSVWRDGRATDLDIPPGYAAVDLVAVNDHGWILGRGLGQTGDRGLLWIRGAVTDLGTLGGTGTWVGGMNNRGDVFGLSETADGALRPFLWRGGRMIDLTSVGVPEDATVNGINDRGDLAGSTGGAAVVFQSR